MQNNREAELIRNTIQNTEFGLLDTCGEEKLLKFLDIAPNTMTSTEEYAKKQLDNVVKIYRGISTDNDIDFKKFGYGINWTTNKDVALWFAQCRGGTHKALLSASILKSDIICLWQDKDESEVIIDPRNIIKTTLKINIR